YDRALGMSTLAGGTPMLDRRATGRGNVIGRAGAWLGHRLITLLGATCDRVAEAWERVRPSRADRPAAATSRVVLWISGGVIIAVALFYLYARIGLVGTALGLILGHTVLAIPFVVITVMAVLKTYDDRLDQAAASLGAGPVRTLRHVTLPLIRTGLLAAFLFA